MISIHIGFGQSGKTFCHENLGAPGTQERRRLRHGRGATLGPPPSPEPRARSADRSHAWELFVMLRASAEGSVATGGASEAIGGMPAAPRKARTQARI